MEELLALIAVLLGGAFVVSPIVALFLVLELRKKNARLEKQVKEHPGRTLLIAAGLGYLIGKAFRNNK